MQGIYLKNKTLPDLFKAQKESLNYFFDHMDLSQIESLVELIKKTKGIIFFTGVGKSGFIAQKIAATFVSIGIKAMFLAPIDALHGDLGIVDTEDTFIVLSKSGESDEILNLIPCVRNKGACVVSMISKKNSRLERASDQVIYLPIDKELCPYDIVPTTSTEVQLICGDVLSVALMHQKGLSLDQFATNHPAGKIGKKLTYKVRDLMLTGDRVPFCSLEDSLEKVLPKLTEKRCGCLLIVDSNQILQGIFTDGDLRRALQMYGSQTLHLLLKDLKVSFPKVVAPEKMAWEALRIMEADQQRPFMVLPVVDDQKKVHGLIKMHDILQSGLG